MRLTLLTMVLALAAGVSFAQLKDKPSWEAMKGSGFKGVPLVLVPVGEPMKDKRSDAKEVWSGLIGGMARDGKTQALMKHLLRCQTIEIALLPEKADGNFQPPSPTGKSQVYFGIRLSDGEAGKDEFNGCILGTAHHLAFEVPETRKWIDKATVWEAFVIAANEHLYRNKKGFHLCHGILLDPSDLDDRDAGIRDLSKRGKYLEKQIRGFLDAYKN